MDINEPARFATIDSTQATLAAATATKTVYVRDISPSSGIVRDWFLMVSKEQRLTQQQKPYLALTFADKTGRIEARWWDADQDATDAKDGDIVKLEATPEKYLNGVQLKVSRLYRPGPFATVPVPDMACFYPASNRDPLEMFAEVEQIIGAAIPDPYNRIRQLLNAVIHDEAIAPLFMRAPAASKYHHAYLSGLLEHVLSLMNAALALSAHYDFDVPVVLAGCVLHDIGKCWELEWAKGTKYARAGILYGHIAIGFSLVKDYCQRLGIDSAVSDPILHIIASHHGTKEHGSPVEPVTREAAIFHALDKLDAVLAAVDAAEELPSDEDAAFTPYIPALRTRYVRRAQPQVREAEEPTT